MTQKNIFMSIGAAKTGTTWLYRMLKDHEDIFFSNEKEIHYFAQAHLRDWSLDFQARSRLMINKSNHLKKLSDEAFKQHLIWYANFLEGPLDDNWYKRLFENQKSEKYIADFSNSTCLLNKRGLKHIKRNFDQTKLIYTLRDPVNRLLSLIHI